MAGGSSALAHGRAYWSFKLYPEAREGGGCFVPTYRRVPVGGGAPDPERSQEEAGTAGAGEAAPLLRGQSAQSLRGR